MIARILTFFPTTAKRFARDEQGSMTIWGLFVWFICGILGALALDVTYLVSSRTHLQVAADQAAHAAIYQRYLMDEDTETLDDVRDRALALVSATLPSGRYGIAMNRSDIEFGTFNTTTRTWTVDNASGQAVRAVARFDRDRNNAAISFLFRLIGRDDFDVAAEAIFVAYGKACLREGYVADGRVDIQSNNEFKNGFCIHSNDHVSVNQRNTYEAGTIVSMPNVEDLDIPGGVDYGDDGEIDPKNFKLNDGLIQALTAGYIDMRIMPRVENMIHYYSGEHSYYGDDAPNPNVWNDSNLSHPGYIDPAYTAANTIVTIAAKNKALTTADILAAGAVTAAEAVASIPTDPDTGLPDVVAGPATPETNGTGRVYYITCQGNAGLTIDASSDVLSDVVIISPCEIKFSNGSAIESARVITTATSADSISATNGLIVGQSGTCARGAEFFSLGGMRFPSGLEIHGSQLIAKGDIQFAANANGLTGASFISMGEIDGTSNGDMSLCDDPTQLTNRFQITYFRMAG